jgi:hypothetical protein
MLNIAQVSFPWGKNKAFETVVVVVPILSLGWGGNNGTRWADTGGQWLDLQCYAHEQWIRS